MRNCLSQLNKLGKKGLVLGCESERYDEKVCAEANTYVKVSLR